MCSKKLMKYFQKASRVKSAVCMYPITSLLRPVVWNKLNNPLCVRILEAVNSWRVPEYMYLVGYTFWLVLLSCLLYTCSSTYQPHTIGNDPDTAMSGPVVARWVKGACAPNFLNGRALTPIYSTQQNFYAHKLTQILHWSHQLTQMSCRRHKGLSITD